MIGVYAETREYLGITLRTAQHGTSNFLLPFWADEEDDG